MAFANTKCAEKTSRKGGRRTNELEALRRKAGMTLEVLARHTGLAVSTLCRIERGQAKAHPSTMRLVRFVLKSGKPARR